MLIRSAPAAELTVATRILARAGVLAADGRVALLVGTEVVYVAARGAGPHTMTPYDVAALRLADGLRLEGEPPADAARYLAALAAAPGARAAALSASGEMVTAPDARTLVGAMLRRPFEDAEAEARASGALIGAYPLEAETDW